MVKVDADGCSNALVVYCPFCTGKDGVEGFEGEEGRWGTGRGIYLALLFGFGDVGMEGLGIDPDFVSIMGIWELNSSLMDAMGADTSARDFCLYRGAVEG